MALGPHAGFIVVAYAAALAVIAALIGWVYGAYRRQRRSLAELEQQGVTRRAPVRKEPP